MFVEEFCRFRGVPSEEIDGLRISGRQRNPVGFVTEVIPSSVPPALEWGVSVFNSLRVAVVGPNKVCCGMLLFFDPETRKLDAIEGFVDGGEWPKIENPAYWSEIERVLDLSTKG